MKSPLPDGCKFFVYPRYIIVYKGRIIKLGKYSARILLILMSKPGRDFTRREIARELYDDRVDGGPYWDESVISKLIWVMLKKFAKAGLTLNLKTEFSKQRYVYHALSISVSDQAGVAPEITHVGEALWPKPRKKRKPPAPKKPRQRQRYKYNTEFFVPERDPALWVFPQHMENRLTRLAIHSPPDRR